MLPRFKKELDVAFGQLKVYFDRLRLTGAEVLVDVVRRMKLYIPHGVKTQRRRAVEHAGEPDAPTLTISGNVSFGDLNVEYV